MNTALGLGTRLRQLLDLLDGDVDARYERAGLDYRARFTPVMIALAAGEARPIKEIAVAGRMSHPAACQTIELMAKKQLVEIARGEDGRERLVRLASAGCELLARLQPIWAATDRAARALSDEIGAPLDQLLDRAVAALQRQSFGDRIESAAKDV